MKSNFFISTVLMMTHIASYAQISPERYNATHSDSCWHFTFEYDIPKVPSDNGMLVVTHLCTPDTCISSTTKHLHGKRYNKRYIKRYGHSPILSQEGINTCTLTIPETEINDTIYGITYCEYDDRKTCRCTYDTIAICMPEVPSMSCHRIEPRQSMADHIAMEHPHVKNIAQYTPLTNENASNKSTTPNVVRYRTNSSKLDTGYLQNAKSIDELMEIINSVLSDSATTIEAIQFTGYTSPDGSETVNKDLGYLRAKALREHVKKHHQLPDSVFEIANGGKNWEMVYNDIREMNIPDKENLITMLKAEESEQKREIILKRYDRGHVYKELLEKMFPSHRIACCTGIYYHNKPDSIAIALNKIVDELINNPKPDYGKLIEELKQYRNDPRVLNLQGFIEYRRHHRHAAEQAFNKAAKMGDKQALLNLNILKDNKRR